MRLTEEQEVIVREPIDSRMVVEAIPGSGKTEVLAWRLAHLLNEGARPGQVMVLSFSNAAVRTLVARLRKVARSQQGYVDDLRHVSVRTFDSWAFRLLIASGRDVGEILKSSYEGNVTDAISAIKTGGQGVESVFSGIRHVFIDEVQDLTGVRAELAKEILAKVCGKGHPAAAGFTLLGDRQQGIYGFSSYSGEDRKLQPSFLDSIASGWADSLCQKKLTVNHRLTAELFSSSSTARKALEGRNGRAALDEIRKVLDNFPKVETAVSERAGSTAILCRTNAQALIVADKIWGRDEVMKGGFPFLNAGDQLYLAPSWIARIFSNASDVKELTRELFCEVFDHYLPGKDGISCSADAWKFLQKCLKCSPDSASIDLEKLRERLNWADFLPDDEKIPDGDTLEITTIHQSKGREFDNVVLLDSPLVDTEMTEHELEEEARVIYVGMTRSRRFVKVWLPSSKMDMYSKNLWKGRSRLVRHYPGSLVMEAGLRRDINPISFIDPTCVGEDTVTFQDYLWSNRKDLVGRKVVLVKNMITPKKYEYRICLQVDGKPGKVLGSMSGCFLEEMLGAHNLAAKRYGLPGQIYNLRISSICSYSAQPEDLTTMPAPWSSSGFWLGIGLTGLGLFKVFKNAR